MESSLGGVQGAMQINAQNPRKHLSRKFQLILFWDKRRMKAGILKTAICTDKLVPLTLTERLNLFIILHMSQFSKGPSVYYLASLHPCLLSTLCDNLRTPRLNTCEETGLPHQRI